MFTRLKLVFFLVLPIQAFLSIINLSAQPGPGGIGDQSGNSSLRLWLRVSECENQSNWIDGQYIDLWTDLSGSGNHVYSQGNQRPTYAFSTTDQYSGIRFRGNEFLQSSPTMKDWGSSDATLFVAYRGGIFSGTMVALRPSSTTPEYAIVNSTAAISTNDGAEIRQIHPCAATIEDRAISLSSATFEEGTNQVKFYINGQQSNQAQDPDTLAPLLASWSHLWTIGKQTRNNPEFFRGVLFEVIAYDRLLKDDERRAVENYLRCRYNIRQYCNDFSYSVCRSCVHDVDFHLPKDTIPIDSCLNITNLTQEGCTAFQWFFGGAEPGSSFLPQPGQVCFRELGKQQLRLVVQDECGNDTISKPIVVVDPECELKAAFNLSSEEIIAGDCIETVDLSKANIQTWAWAFEGANMTSSRLKNPGPLCFDEPGLHSIYLAVKNECGSDTTSRVVMVTSPMPENICLYIPNAFSPNGDGINDVFRPGIDPDCSIDNYNMRIFDRQGAKLFETEDQEQGWNGGFEQERLTPDILMCLVTFEINGKPHFNKSEFLLLR